MSLSWTEVEPLHLYAFRFKQSYVAYQAHILLTHRRQTQILTRSSSGYNKADLSAVQTLSQREVLLSMLRLFQGCWSKIISFYGHFHFFKALSVIMRKGFVWRRDDVSLFRPVR